MRSLLLGGMLSASVFAAVVDQPSYPVPHVTKPVASARLFVDKKTGGYAGYLLMSVKENSALGKLGAKSGDILVELNGKSFRKLGTDRDARSAKVLREGRVLLLTAPE